MDIQTASIIEKSEVMDIQTASIIEKSEVWVPEKVIIEEAHAERPSFRYSFDKEPLILGDIIELIILKNGKEQDRLKTVIENEPKIGNEIRPLLNLDIVEMMAFSKAEEIKL
jgi:hypothetical protein